MNEAITSGGKKYKRFYYIVNSKLSSISVFTSIKAEFVTVWCSEAPRSTLWLKETKKWPLAIILEKQLLLIINLRRVIRPSLFKFTIVQFKVRPFIPQIYKENPRSQVIVYSPVSATEKDWTSISMKVGTICLAALSEPKLGHVAGQWFQAQHIDTGKVKEDWN